MRRQGGPPKPTVAALSVDGISFARSRNLDNLGLRRALTAPALVVYIPYPVFSFVFVSLQLLPFITTCFVYFPINHYHYHQNDPFS